MRKLLALVLPALLFCMTFTSQSAGASTDGVTAQQLRERTDLRAAGRYAEGLDEFAAAMQARTTCPVPGSTFVDSWHAPRAGHLHAGTDMMAPDGTPIVAVQAGVYRRHGAESFYLDADDGTQWFGTHLQEHVAADGAHVNAGDLVALVGHSGNASASGPHLHMELHPGGGEAAPSYATLAALCEGAAAPSNVTAAPERQYYSAPRPSFPFRVHAVHAWVNSTRPVVDRIDRPTAVTATRYLNALVVHYLRAVMAATAIPYEANWDRVAACESGGNWSISTGNGYYGGVQFSLATWQAVGGSGYPHQNSKAEQIRRAEILRQRSGLGQWPVCGPRWYG